MLEVFVSALLGCALGWFLRSKLVRQDRLHAEVALGRTEQALAAARILYLETLRREIGNILLSQEPDLLVRAYRRAWQYQDEILALPNERREADFHSLTQKLKYYQDFDLLGIRHVVPYSEEVRRIDMDQIVERYLEINRMLLFIKLDTGDRSGRLGDDEFGVLLQSLDRLRSQG